MSKAKEILSQLQAYYHKIENEQFSPEDLEEMVRLSRELHERSVILRYKSFEQKVFDGKQVSVETSTEKATELEPESVDKVQEIDFSIFEERGDVMDTLDEPEVEETEVPIVEEPQNEVHAPAFDFGSPTVAEEKVVEVNQQEMAKEELSKLDSAEDITDEVNEQEEVTEEISQNSTEVIEKSKGEWIGYFGKVAQEMHSNFISSINSISGSFGLNERLLYSNELFNSDSEAFSEGIKNLDACADWNQCMDTLDQLASNLNWERENETVAEFVGHVYRKYA
ncbi:MAG: hypothetical protein N4A41_00720 [Crocinitomicaceae bacterium]|jgi:hypothetical protein|nr:hypothetical protein [Crocinitomicaceae bacterium]